MDYEKAYKDALERAKGIYNENPSLCGRIFPEIKESEDERIRKSLLKLVSNDKNNGYTEFYKAEGITCDDAIAYLEKQQESNPSTTENISAAYQLGLANGRKEQKPVEGDNETEIQKAFREGKSAGRKEVFDHPEEYGLQKEQKPSIKEPKYESFEDGNATGWRIKQQPADWSEEDEKLFSLARIAIWSDEKLTPSIQRKILRRLDSLRPQPHWKPSADQMDALDEYIWAKEPNKDKAKYVISLYRDLKKLL